MCVCLSIPKSELTFHDCKITLPVASNFAQTNINRHIKHENQSWPSWQKFFEKIFFFDWKCSLEICIYWIEILRCRWNNTIAAITNSQNSKICLLAIFQVTRYKKLFNFMVCSDRQVYFAKTFYRRAIFFFTYLPWRARLFYLNINLPRRRINTYTNTETSSIYIDTIHLYQGSICGGGVTKIEKWPTFRRRRHRKFWKVTHFWEKIDHNFSPKIP